MRVRWISKPKDGGDHRKNIVSKEVVIGKQIAEMVFKMNPIFKECWVAFFSNKILWYTDPPELYYIQNSYYYQREG